MRHNTLRESDFNYFKDAVHDCFLGDHTRKEFWNLRYQTLKLLNRMIYIYPEDADKIMDIWESIRREGGRNEVVGEK